MYRALLALSATAVLAGCSVFTQPAAKTEFTCDDGTRLTVEFGRDIAAVEREDGKSFVLSQEETSTGYWYTSGRYELRGNGKEATWSADARRTAKCQAK